MILRFSIITSLLLALVSSCSQSPKSAENQSENPYYSRTDTARLTVSNSEWKKLLKPDLYAVAREQATERAFSGKHWNSEAKGTYYCAVCGNQLFRSQAKFASSCGWPSFFESTRPNSVLYRPDHSHGLNRTEVLCARCDSHLGHLFNDGPAPTRKRFCMNSISLDFEPDDISTATDLVQGDQYTKP